LRAAQPRNLCFVVEGNDNFASSAYYYDHGQRFIDRFGSLGDLHPLIAIGLELRQSGHNVWFCAGATFCPSAASGFHFL
jgi:hypothetical protein